MAKLSLSSSVRLNTGFEMPALGFGVYKTPAKDCEEVVLHALKTGYRHIDSATVYTNEGPCAAAMKKSGIPRSDIFFTTKIPPRKLGYESAKSSIATSLSTTGLEYIDLILIHAPYGGPENRKGAWRALVEAQQAGQVRSIGVSNYGVHHLEELSEHIKQLSQETGHGGKVSVGQWEMHPWLDRSDIVKWCKAHDVVFEAYCPIVRGERFEEPALQALAKKHQKTPAQILIRWSLQKGYVPLPKSVTPHRIEENAKLYDFELSEAEVAELQTTEYAPCSWDPTKAKLEE